VVSVVTAGVAEKTVDQNSDKTEWMRLLSFSEAYSTKKRLD